MEFSLTFKYKVFVISTMFTFFSSYAFYCLIYNHLHKVPPLVAVTLNMKGTGLGNHMFRYASTLGILKDNPGIDVCVSGLKDVAFLRHSKSAFILHVDVLTNNSLRPCTYFEDLISFTVSKEFNPPYATYQPYTNNGPTIITGYLQSFKYFQNLPHPFFKLKQQEAASQWLAKRRLNSVIHVRRGDKTYQMAVPLQFYETALKITGSRVAIVTDDPNWVKAQKIFQNASVSCLHDPGFDMAIIAAATENVIISVGTFGWWGAYLSNATKKYYYAMQSYGTWDTNFKEDDYIPHDWIKLNLNLDKM